MEIICPECGTDRGDFEPDELENLGACPDCGFHPDNCDHPVEYRESEWVLDHGENTHVELAYCGKCGKPVRNF